MTKKDNDHWDVGFDRMPSIQFHENDSVEIGNVRNFRYECDGSHSPCWETRTYDLSATRFADFIVVPFAKRSDLAHTMVSFGFSNGRYLSISVEARRKVGQPYSILKGLFGAFSLGYVIADERDVIGHRTEIRGDDGLLKHDQSFETIAKLATINDLANGQWHRDDFSHLIRTRLGEYCPNVHPSPTNKSFP